MSNTVLPYPCCHSRLLPHSLPSSFLYFLPSSSLALTSTQMWPEKTETETEKLFLLILSLHFPQYLPSDFIFKQQQCSVYLPLLPRLLIYPSPAGYAFLCALSCGYNFNGRFAVGDLSRLLSVLCSAFSKWKLLLPIPVLHPHSTFLASSTGQSPLFARALRTHKNKHFAFTNSY